MLYENISESNLVCNNKTPFDSYYAPQDNEEHIYLTNENYRTVCRRNSNYPT